MIAKITRGASFRGAARYVLDERRGLDRDHQAEMIGGNMAGRTSAELTREFEAVRQQRPDIGKPRRACGVELRPGRASAVERRDGQARGRVPQAKRP